MAVRPLRVEELAEVLAVNFNCAGGIPKLNPDWRWADQEEAVLTACSSLVTIVNDGRSRVVQFSHFSVKEFLMSSRLFETGGPVARHHILLEPAHTIFAQACLGVLLQLEYHIHRDDVDGFPLVRYAAEHWVSHAQFGDVSSSIKDGMLCLFDSNKSHFRIWLWIHNEDRSWNSMSAMRPSSPEAVPLYYASRFGFRHLVERLLADHPKHVNAGGGSYGAPLIAALSEGHVQVASLLYKHGAVVDIRGKWDQTALHRASVDGHLENGKWLLDRGANVNACDNEGWTPLYLAALHGHLEFARMLLERDAKVNVCDDLGRTPLSRASENGRVKVVQLLLEHGADMHARDVRGKTASQIASEKKQRAIVQLLSEYKKKSSHAHTHNPKRPPHR